MASTSPENPGQQFFLTFSSHLPSPVITICPSHPPFISSLPTTSHNPSKDPPPQFLKLASIALSKSLEGNPFWELKIPECCVFLLPDSLTSRSDHLWSVLKSHLSGSLLGSASPSSQRAVPILAVHSASDEECCRACPLLSQETLQYESQSWCPALKQAVDWLWKEKILSRYTKIAHTEFLSKALVGESSCFSGNDTEVYEFILGLNELPGII